MMSFIMFHVFPISLYDSKAQWPVQGDGGAIQTMFQVEPDELLVAVMQEQLHGGVLKWGYPQITQF